MEWSPASIATTSKTPPKGLLSVWCINMSGVCRRCRWTRTRVRYVAGEDFADPETEESRGTVRKHSVGFLDKNIYFDKTLSLAVLVSDEVAVQLRAAMRESVKNVTEYAGQHFTTRRTVDGRTM